MVDRLIPKSLFMVNIRLTQAGEAGGSGQQRDNQCCSNAIEAEAVWAEKKRPDAGRLVLSDVRRLSSDNGSSQGGGKASNKENRSPYHHQRIYERAMVKACGGTLPVARNHTLSYPDNTIFIFGAAG